MITWIVVALAALAFGGWVAARSRRRAPQPALPAAEGTPLLERTVREVRPGDVVQHDGRDWLVEGVITYDEDGHTWRAAHLADGGRARWMVVGLERGGPLTVRLLEEADDVALTGYPPETLPRGGVTYRLAQRGTATATFAGDLGGLGPAAREARSAAAGGATAPPATACSSWSSSATATGRSPARGSAPTPWSSSRRVEGRPPRRRRRELLAAS